MSQSRPKGSALAGYAEAPAPLPVCVQHRRIGGRRHIGGPPPRVGILKNHRRPGRSCTRVRPLGHLAPLGIPALVRSVVVPRPAPDSDVRTHRMLYPNRKPLLTSAILVALTSIPTLIVVAAGSATLDGGGPPRAPVVAGPVETPLIVGPGGSGTLRERPPAAGISVAPPTAAPSPPGRARAPEHHEGGDRGGSTVGTGGDPSDPAPPPGQAGGGGSPPTPEVCPLSPSPTTAGPTSPPPADPAPTSPAPTAPAPTAPAPG